MNGGSVTHIFMIAIGGAIGAVFRVYLSQWISRLFFFTMPMGILITNLMGCFLMGLMASLCDKYHVSSFIKLFIISGGLGAFTTFSTFAFETTNLISSGHLLVTLGYILSSVVGGVLVFWFGSLII